MLPSLLPLCVQFGIQLTRAEPVGGGFEMAAVAVGLSASDESPTLDSSGALTLETAEDVVLGRSTGTGGEQWTAKVVAMSSNPE